MVVGAGAGPVVAAGAGAAAPPGGVTVIERVGVVGVTLTAVGGAMAAPDEPMRATGSDGI